MLKSRIIPVLLVDGPSLVKGSRFDNWRRVGTLPQAVKVHNARDVDELILIDVRSSRGDQEFNLSLLDQVRGRLFVPLTFGGGLRSVDDASRAIAAGADKVVIGAAATTDTRLIERIADRFGSQAIVGAIDARRHAEGTYRCLTHGGSVDSGLDVRDHARALEESGVGEILITSVDNDGTMKGYDLSLLQQIVRSVSVPVIASGGAGSERNFVEAFRTGAAAAAAGSVFQFTQLTPSDVRRALSAEGFPVRSVIAKA